MSRAVILTFRQLPQGATLSFFDDDEPRTRVRPRSPAPAAIGPPSDPQQLMVRRAAAAGIAVLVVVLLVFGINGCLNSRREQALKDYNRDVSSLVQDADANADDFFDALAGATSSAGTDAASTDVQSEINQLRTGAQALTKRAEGLDVPGDMRPAQVNLLLSLSLVHEAIGKVAEKIPAALSTDSATAVPAVRGIAGEMQSFTAADVVYNRRTAALVKQVLDDNDIGGQVIQNSSFLQNLGWLQPSTVARRIDSQAGRGAGAGDGGSTEPTAGTHGHGLLAVSVGDTALTAGQGNSLTASSNVTFNVKVANQGDNPEQDVRVRIRITGAGDPIRAEEVIDQTQSKTETTVAIKLDQAPPIGQAITITAEVLPVNGEKNTENNQLTFPAIFRRS